MARHSDIRLTLGLYTHTILDDGAAAVRRLPAPKPNVGHSGTQPPKESTTQGESVGDQGQWQQLGSNSETQDGETGQGESPDDLRTSGGEVPGSSPQVFETSRLGTRSRRVAGSNKSEAAGTRTRDLRIKSPLLYRLSYSLWCLNCFVFSVNRVI